jgi:Methyltransferase domain
MSQTRAPYIDLLARIHRYLKPRTYLEIGVQKGRSFQLVGERTSAVGIDPEPLLPPGAGSGQVFAVPSDDFFRDHDLREVLDGTPVDLAFIDGMHLFEFALRDFINVERFCTPGSLVLVHDCNPPKAFMASRERKTAIWSGDVWKLVIALQRARPDLSVAVVDVPPSGLGVITRLDPRSRVLEDRYEDLRNELIGLDYDWLERDRKRILNLIPNDWEAVLETLPPPFAA